MKIALSVSLIQSLTSDLCSEMLRESEYPPFEIGVKAAAREDNKKLICSKNGILLCAFDIHLGGVFFFEIRPISHKNLRFGIEIMRLLEPFVLGGV